MIFKDICILVLWTKVASALEGLNCHLYGPYWYINNSPQTFQPAFTCQYTYQLHRYVKIKWKLMIIDEIQQWILPAYFFKAFLSIIMPYFSCSIAIRKKEGREDPYGMVKNFFIPEWTRSLGFWRTICFTENTSENYRRRRRRKRSVPPWLLGDKLAKQNSTLLLWRRPMLPQTKIPGTSRNALGLWWNEVAWPSSPLPRRPKQCMLGKINKCQIYHHAASEENLFLL